MKGYAHIQTPRAYLAHVKAKGLARAARNRRQKQRRTGEASR